MRIAWPLPWPLPALLAWGCAWGVFWTGLGWGQAPWLALAMASALGVGLSVLARSWWRRTLIGLGFPLSLALSGVAATPAWAWLLPLALLLLVYPLNAWRDAPLFPTPAHALRELATQAPLAAQAPVLDAGCGLGAGLAALREAYPACALHGLESSWLLALGCALRCPWARVRRGDIWRADWRPYALVYLFQRPESMPRAVAKAQAELAAGGWLVSLEFEAEALQPSAILRTADGRPLWLYRAPLQIRPAANGPADIPAIRGSSSHHPLTILEHP